MRILQIFNRYLQYGGEEAAVYETGDALQGPHDVEYFITSTQDWIDQRKGNRWLMLKDTLHNSEVLHRLRLAQKAGNFDVWQIHNIFPAMSPSVYAEAFRQGIPVVQYLHNYRLACVNGFFLNHGEPCKRCIQGNFWPALQTACWRDSHLQSGAAGAALTRIRGLDVLNRVTAWVAISERQKEIHVQMGIPAEKIHVVPHCLEWSDPPLPQSVEPVILFVGRLSAEKGVADLLQAWAKVKTRATKLLIVGDGPERAALEAQSRKMGLVGVEFLGYLSAENQKPIWQRALASVVPSIWEEPFGKVVLEAWAYGRPVIGPQIGALTELIEPGVTGFLAKPFDSDSLAVALDQALAHPDLTYKMGLQGYATLLSKFNKSRWLNDISEVYRLPVFSGQGRVET